MWGPSKGSTLTPHIACSSRRGKEHESILRTRCERRGQVWMPGPTGKTAPAHPLLFRDLGLVSQAHRAQSQPAPWGTGLRALSPARCHGNKLLRGNQRGSHPERAEADVALGNSARWFLCSSSPTFGSGPREEQGEDRSQRDSCRVLGKRGRPFRVELGTETHAQRASFVWEHKTTTPSMARGGLATPVRPVAQRAYGSWSFLLLGGLSGGMGWAWGARALGCLRRKGP